MAASSTMVNDHPTSVAAVEPLGPPAGRQSARRSFLKWVKTAGYQSSTKLLSGSSAPGILVSLILHTSLLLLLALWTIVGAGYGGLESGYVATIMTEQASSDMLAVETMLASGEVKLDVDATANPSSSVSTDSTTDPAQASSIGTAGNDLQQLDSFDGNAPGTLGPQRSSAAGDMIKSTAESTVASFSHSNIDGRKPESRQRLAGERGGSAESEAAVELALEWLAAHQRPNGSWSLIHTTDRCGPHCTHPGSPERYEPAATGLALLAYLGAGYTHRDGKYATVVRRGIYYLLQTMEAHPQGGSFLFSNPQGMYNQGVATFALCEAYQLSRDESLRKPTQRAVDFIAFAQNDMGGWGYLPRHPGDLTITGWQTMALKSARSAELYVPAHTIVRIDKFLNSQTDHDKVYYGYGRPSTAESRSETCTAIGLLLRIFRGWPHTDPRVLAGVTHLERQGISGHDLYRNYYATLLLFHVGGPTFERWNPPMRDALVRSQNRLGHAAGSWHFEDKFGDVGGRLYSTAMAAMTLEVYYRFSPIYLNSDQPFEY